MSLVLSRSLADPRYRCDGCKRIVPLDVGITTNGETHWCPTCAYRIGAIDRREFMRWVAWHAGRATGPRLPGIAPRRERP